MFRGRKKKITTTRKHLTISFGVRRNRYKTDRIAFLYFKKYSFWFILTAFKRERSSFVFSFVDPLKRNRKFIARLSLFNHQFRIQLIVSREFNTCLRRESCFETCGFYFFSICARLFSCLSFCTLFFSARVESF